jgi:hypothetical protein
MFIGDATCEFDVLISCDAKKSGYTGNYVNGVMLTADRVLQCMRRHWMALGAAGAYLAHAHTRRVVSPALSYAECDGCGGR